MRNFVDLDTLFRHLCEPDARFVVAADDDACAQPTTNSTVPPGEQA
jgi:hypothetical protein